MARQKTTDYYANYLRDLRTSTTYTTKQLDDMLQQITISIDKAKKRIEAKEKGRALKSLNDYSDSQKKAIYEELQKKFGTK